MAYAELYKHTQNPQYLYKITELLKYEDSLYLDTVGNWADLRAPKENNHAMNAWCHGMAGKLLIMQNYLQKHKNCNPSR